MNRLLPQSMPIIPESCLTVPRYVFDLLVISEGAIITFAEDKLRQNERVIPNAWHRIVRRTLTLQAPSKDLLKETFAGSG